MIDPYEARGPHLPDVVTRQSPWVYVFVAAALVHAWLGWRVWSGQGLWIDGGEIFLLKDNVDNAIVSLLGAALFIRHSDARRSLPLLAFGLGLFALGALLDLFRTPFSEFLDSLSPPSADFNGFSPARVAYNALTTVIGAGAALYVGVGLRDQRRHSLRRAERGLALWLTIIAIVFVVGLSVPIGWFGVPTTQVEWALVGLGALLNLLHTLAWCYVLVVAFGGWLAGESPRLGWVVVAIAAGIVLAIPAVSVVSVLLANSTGESSPLLYVPSIAVSVSWILLLSSFALGLPATVDPPEATPPGSAAG